MTGNRFYGTDGKYRNLNSNYNIGKGMENKGDGVKTYSFDIFIEVVILNK